MKLHWVAGFVDEEISRFAMRSIDCACYVVSHRLAYFHQVNDSGFTHEAIVTGAGTDAAPQPVFRWAGTTLKNIKPTIVGTHRAFRSKRASLYLAIIEYRNCRRYELASLVPRLGYAVTHATSMPYRLLKLAQNYG